jgi:tetratricopeptide (TPR) repeat protein
MTREQRQSLERVAERHLRRGELSEALAQFEALALAFPGDAPLASRVAEMRENLQPAELLNPRSNFHSEPDVASRGPVDEAEAMAARGDYAGAMARYRQLLSERPDSELIRDRLAELFRMVQAQRPRDPPPRLREALLSELLGRISSRRRRA